MFFGGDPFEHFAQAGMHGGRPGGRPGRPAANVDTTKLYETLGVSFILRQEFCKCCTLHTCRMLVTKNYVHHKH